MNGKLAAAIGALVLAASALFAFLGAVPWASKSEIMEIKTTIGQRLDGIERDVREIRTFLLGERLGERRR